jgi:hypothetical protein
MPASGPVSGDPRRRRPIRSLSLVGPPIREQVTVFEPPHRFAYKMLSGVPVRRNRRAGAAGGRPTATWRIESIPKFPVPAAVWSAFVRPAIKILLTGVKKKAEIRAE